MLRIVIIFFVISFINCSPKDSNAIKSTFPKGGLLTTSFKSLDDFKKVVKIKYSNKGNPCVKLTHVSNGATVISELKSGVSEADFLHAKAGNFWDKMLLALNSPYFVANRKDLLRVYILSRRRHKDFGWPDIAFYDLAETMKNNIHEKDLILASVDELSEKGYINTFNHIVAQSIMTTLFSEELADFVADTHERKNMPELITGDFTEDQLHDIKNGAVDNYVDIINNEWGQDLGKYLKQKYNIHRGTKWTPELMTDYLNEFQRYFSRVFKLRFKPFTSDDELTKKYSKKINRIMNDVSGMW